jgi:hypothetical protein
MQHHQTNTHHQASTHLKLRPTAATPSASCPAGGASTPLLPLLCPTLFPTLLPILLLLSVLLVLRVLLPPPLSGTAVSEEREPRG